MWLLGFQVRWRSLGEDVSKSRPEAIPAECWIWHYAVLGRVFQRFLRGPDELNAEDVVHKFIMHECMCPSRIRRDLSSHVATPCLCVGFVVGAGVRSQGNFLCSQHISFGSSRLSGHNRPVFEVHTRPPGMVYTWPSRCDSGAVPRLLPGPCVWSQCCPLHAPLTSVVAVLF